MKDIFKSIKFGLLIVVSTLWAQPSFFTWIDDDASSIEAISQVRNIAKKHNLNATYAVIVQNLLKNKPLLDSLLVYQKDGSQIINHSLTHAEKNWKSFSIKNIEYELDRSDFILDSLGFTNHNFFVYPWGNFSNQNRSKILTLIKKKYLLGFNSRGESADLKNYNRYYINRFPIRKHEHITIVKKIIDESLKKGNWIVFLTHSGNRRDFDENYVDEIISYCLSEGMEYKTPKEAFEYLSKSNLLLESNTNDWTFFNELLLLIKMHVGYILFALLLSVGFFTLLLKKIYEKKASK